MTITVEDGTVRTSFAIGGSAKSIDVVIKQGEKVIVMHMDKSDAETIATALKEVAKIRR